MSQENVEVVRSLIEAWNNADYSTVAARTDPAIVVEAKLGRLVDGRYEGIVAAQEWLADFWGNFQDVHTTIKDVVTEGDHVVIWAQLSGRGRSSGVHVDMENWQVFTIRGDKVTSYRLFNTKAEALEAAGLSE